MKQPFRPKQGQMRLLGALLLLVVLAMVLIQQGSRHNAQSPFSRTYIKADGDTLDIGIELNPSIYAVRGDTITGHDYEILQEISHREGVPMKYHPFVPLMHALEYLDQGLYDVVVTSAPATTELKEHHLTTIPVYLDREILVQRVDSAGHPPITSQIQLANDTLAVPSNSPIIARIRNLAHEIGDTIYVEQIPECSAEHLFLLVATGVVKQAVINERIANAMVEEYPMVDISTPISFNQFQIWILQKDNHSLLDSLNHWIKAVNK